MSSQGRLSYDELLASLEELLQELKVPQKRSTMMAEEIADLLHDMGVSLDGYVAPEDVAEDEKEEKNGEDEDELGGEDDEEEDDDEEDD